MNRLFPSLLAGWLGGAALALCLTTLAAADEPPQPAPPVTWQVAPQFFPPVKPSDYWLGIGFQPLDEALRAQLALPLGQGLLVQQVMPETPAAKAGIKQHDIVLKANGKLLGKMQELIDAVDAAKDAEMSLEIIRGGKPVTVKVKPEKRPQGPLALGHPGPVAGPQEWVTDMMGRLWQTPHVPGQPYRFQFLNPGVILPPGAPVHPPLPGDLSVTIRKQGNEPAKIDVRRGDETWSVDENSLDSLPPDTGIHVKRMLGGVPLGGGAGTIVGIETGNFPRATHGAVPALKADGGGRLEKRMEEMSRRIERLQDMIEGLRENRPREKGPDKKPAKPKTPKVEQEQA